MNDNNQTVIPADAPLNAATKASLEGREDVDPEVDEQKRTRFVFNGEEMSLYGFQAGVMNYVESATPADLERWTAALRALQPGQSLDMREIGCGEGVVTRVADP